MSDASAHAVVLFFAATDCSVSNRYVPEIQRMQKEFAQEGVRFWFVYPNPEDTAAIVAAHDAQFAITSNTVLDKSQTLVRQAHVVATPEAAVFLREGDGLREVYHGRIDDRYLSFGHERPHAMHHDLEVAIQAALAHRPVPPPGGDPVGCAIMPLNL
ncbi:MAG: redoxin domain-containing protein [Acidobacteriaceae bacterium]